MVAQIWCSPPLNLNAINIESVCKVIHAVSNRKFSDAEKISKLTDARRFILAWGMDRDRMAEANHFIRTDSMLQFAQSVSKM